LVEEIKSLYEDRLPVIAGNVCTAEGTEFLLEKGADGLRVGLGPGLGCVTRLVSGAGMPQITAVLECAKVANRNKYDVPIISDGGIRESGDVAKAIAAGASSVMIGSIFGATDESPAQEEMVEGAKIKRYRGMGSPEALAKRAGVGRYIGPKGGRVYEGVERPVQYRGSMEKVLNELVGGLKTGMFYSGKKTVDHLRLYGKLKVITPASQWEGHKSFGV
jgi:IMP dehydrogenase